MNNDFKLNQLVAVTNFYCGETPSTENTFGVIVEIEGKYYTINLLDGSQISGDAESLGMVALPKGVELA